MLELLYLNQLIFQVGSDVIDLFVDLDYIVDSRRKAPIIHPGPELLC